MLTRGSRSAAAAMAGHARERCGPGSWCWAAAVWPERAAAACRRRGRWLPRPGRRSHQGGLTSDGRRSSWRSGSATQNRCTSWSELGLHTFPTYNHGEHVTLLGGKLGRLGSKRGAVPKLDPFTLADLFIGLQRFARVAGSVPLSRPWEAPNARDLDGMTFETWIRKNLRTKVGRAYFRSRAAVFSAESADLSRCAPPSLGPTETLLSVDPAQRDGSSAAHLISERIAGALGDSVLSRPCGSAAGGWSRPVTGADSRRAGDRTAPTLAGRLHHLRCRPGGPAHAALPQAR